MDINTFESFLVVAEEMNFSKAAERLYISQQSLSYSIQRMEQEYGVTLFNRKPRLVLTPAGREMIKYAKKIIDTHNSLKSAMVKYSDSDKMAIQMGMSALRSTHYYVPIWTKFHEKHPACSLELQEAKRGVLQKLVKEGTLTIAVSPVAAKEADLVYIPLVQESRYCCITRSCLERYCPGLDYSEGIRFEQIKDIPFITVKRGAHDNAGEAEIIRKFHLQVAAWCDRRAIAQKFAEKGIGFSIAIPVQQAEYFADHTESTDLLFIPIIETLPFDPNIYAYYSKDTEPSPYLLDLIDTFKEVLSEG